MKSCFFPTVITSAVAAELPVTWLEQQGIAVVRGAGLRSGVLSSENLRKTREDILVVLTGVGPAESRATADLIARQIRPRRVLNFGTAGALALARLSPGDWFAPESLQDEAGLRLQVSRCCTFTGALGGRTHGGKLLSVSSPADPRQRSSGCDGVDMEAFAQAEIFGEMRVAFSVLKRITDRADSPDFARQYRESLPRFRAEAPEFLGQWIRNSGMDA